MEPVFFSVVKHHHLLLLLSVVLAFLQGISRCGIVSINQALLILLFFMTIFSQLLMAAFSSAE